jgi:hypothetical protein
MVVNFMMEEKGEEVCFETEVSAVLLVVNHLVDSVCSYYIPPPEVAAVILNGESRPLSCSICITARPIVQPRHHKHTQDAKIVVAPVLAASSSWWSRIS